VIAGARLRHGYGEVAPKLATALDERRRRKSGPPAMDLRSAVALDDPYDSHLSVQPRAASHDHGDSGGDGTRCAFGPDLPLSPIAALTGRSRPGLPVTPTSRQKRVVVRCDRRPHDPRHHTVAIHALALCDRGTAVRLRDGRLCKPDAEIRKIVGAIPPRVFRPCVRLRAERSGAIAPKPWQSSNHGEGGFELSRISPDVLCRLIPVASNQRLHARAATEHERRRISRAQHRRP